MSRGRLGATYRGQADPQHRHALGLQHADHLFDLLGVELDPAFLAKLIEAVRRARALLRRDGRRRIACRRHRPATIRYRPACRRALRRHRPPSGFAPGFASAGLASGLALASFLSLFLSAVLSSVFSADRLADRDAVIEPEHDDDGVRLLGGEDALGGGGPVGRIALGLILDQAGDGLVLADHAHVGLLGIGVLETIGEPVRHGVTEHQHVALRHAVVALVRRRRAWKNPGAALAAPAAGTARRNRRRTSRRHRCAVPGAAAADRRTCRN